ncbi:N-acyl homoserine lactonase family protein [Actinomadura madurae]|uniref:N-acyl homoserine lactonase family protein n=1 Tax=Actinomadura madurae TaxID=1993 RepID=UPI0020D21965|nr:N-acyl homoserine lactonase family protein [Actinomadura madurae]MCP9952624.1 N-acyl homoserine lactonase family protein [Actinomadura madurae]MCQ0018074.1 N-acyl homoserine lactonase family protein [Actinomadura madurae]
MSDHSIWVLEYGFVDRFPASNLFAAQPNEGHRRMPYCFALVRSADRCALVDTGFADEATYRRLTAKYGRTGWAAPVDVLDRIGVAAAQVDTVILTHNHFDHAGCAGAFPNAHVYIQQCEITQYEAALRRPPRFEYLTRSCQPDLPALLAERERDGLGTRVDGEHEIAPGLTVRPAFDTHTAGSQVVAVSNAADGEWIFAGDNVYSYENLEGLHGDGILAPIAMTTGSAAGLAGLRRHHALRRRRRDPQDHPVPREPDLGAVPLARVRRRAAPGRDQPGGRPRQPGRGAHVNRGSR